MGQESEAKGEDRLESQKGVMAVVVGFGRYNILLVTAGTRHTQTRTRLTRVADRSMEKMSS